MNAILKRLHFLLIILYLSGCSAPTDTTDEEYKNIIIIKNINSANAKFNPAVINSALVRGDSLILNVSYGGGCKEHYFKLFGLEGIIKTNPPQAEIFLSHDSNNDMCEAWITEERQFQLTPLKEFIKNNYFYNGPLILRIYEPGGYEPFTPLPVYRF